MTVEQVLDNLSLWLDCRQWPALKFRSYLSDNNVAVTLREQCPDTESMSSTRTSSVGEVRKACGFEDGFRPVQGTHFARGQLNSSFCLLSRGEDINMSPRE